MVGPLPAQIAPGQGAQLVVYLAELMGAQRTLVVIPLSRRYVVRL
jgi:hypothetical protein